MDSIVGARTPIPSETVRYQEEIRRKYKELELPDRTLSFNEYCYPKEYTLQSQQIFVGAIMAPGGDINELLAYHKIGSGKTCAMIQAATPYARVATKATRPLVIMPASLLGGFRAELRTECTQGAYIDAKTRAALVDADAKTTRDILVRVNKKIDEQYELLSFNGFVKIAPTHREPPILIVDEVQNMMSESGNYYRVLLEFIQRYPRMKVLLLSATPVFDSPSIVFLLLKLLRRDVPENPAAMFFAGDKMINRDAFARMFSGAISYFQGAPAHTFPRVTIKYVECVMSRFQAKWFKDAVDAERTHTQRAADTDAFYSKSRQRSNIVYPGGVCGTDGIALLTPTHLTEHLETYSTKLFRLVRYLARSHELCFVYTSFTSFGGIKIITRVLAAHGWKNYFVAGAGPKRYVVWSGYETARQKEEIRRVYNSAANDNASIIRMVIGSPAMKEGVSLFRTREAYILEPYWNFSRLEQVFGRVIRFCSHKTLPKADRDVVIYVLLAVVARAGGSDVVNSVDKYIISLAERKQVMVKQINDVMIQMSMDRLLNHN